MPDTIHVPIFGNMNKGTAIAGVGALVVVGGYELYKRSKKKTTTATPTQTGQYGYGAYGYGSAYGYGGADLQNGFYGYGFGPSGLGAYSGAGFSPYGYGYYGAGVTGSPVAVQATTNAQWTEAAVTALTAQGYSGTDVLAALGQYLLGHSLTATQSQIVDAAIAAEGYPPTPPANSSPVNQNNGQTGTTGANAAIHVPNVIGQNLATVIRNIENAGLKEHTITPGIANPSNWIAIGQNPAGGTLPPGSTVTVSARKK